MFSKKRVMCVVAAAGFVAAPASAQYMPHLDPNTYILATMNYGNGANTCLTGSPPPEDEIAEAREPAPGVMQAYFNAAQNGGALSQSFRKSKKSQWSHGDTTVSYDQIDAQRDPLAAPGNVLDAEPLRFFRSGDFNSAHGQWAVMDASGAVVGVYDAQFRRKRGEWMLHALAVLGAEATVVPAMQYCSEPGDVADYKVETADEQIENLKEAVEKNTRRLVRDEARLAEARERLTENPNRTRYREAVRRERLNYDRRKEKLDDLLETVEDAQEFQMKSKRDVAEIAAMTVPVADAARLRGFETTTEVEAAEEKAAEEAEAAEG